MSVAIAACDLQQLAQEDRALGNVSFRGISETNAPEQDNSMAILTLPALLPAACAASIDGLHRPRAVHARFEPP